MNGATVRFGMVGGGTGAFIGPVHRQAARMDGELDLVCGAFSSDPAVSRRSGTTLRLDPDRCYSDFETMCRDEAALPDDQRMQFVSIVAPNSVHYPATVAALRHGFHVLCDKPATLNLKECLALRDQLDECGLIYGVTHPYVAYPLIAEAKERAQRGELGVIRKVMVEYTQGWLSSAIEHDGNAQAGWRLDPKTAGSSGCMGDIGVHAFNLAEYVCGLEVVEVCAALNRVVHGRVLDDDGAVLLRFGNGAHGTLVASQICAGEENNLRLRVSGELGSLDWSQQDPNSLCVRYTGRPTEILRTGGPGLGVEASRRTRLPAGHPEGYLEAFANIYRDFATAVRRFPNRDSQVASTVTGIREAARGMAFIETVVQASASSVKWHPFPDLDSATSLSTANWR